MDKLKISGCIITYNEEKNLYDCLESIKDIVDEIVVVDSGSKDKTIEIAKEFGANVYVIPFQGYVKQKNTCIELAKHNWVLCLDADERVSSELREEIKKIKREGADVDGYYVRRKTCYVYKWIKHSDWYPDYKLRLFNKQKGKWTGKDPHDYVEVKGKTKKIPKDLLHYSFDSIEDHINTIQKFTTIGAEELYKDGKKITIFGIIGHAFFIFFKMYILKLGFLDGSAGFIASVLSSFHVFSKYAKLYVKYKKKCRDLTKK
jgi:glycosyltransferase involved in cell wall biosynthesis